MIKDKTKERKPEVNLTNNFQVYPENDNQKKAEKRYSSANGFDENDMGEPT